jgi:hypothetical protein
VPPGRLSNTTTASGNHQQDGIRRTQRIGVRAAGQFETT